MSKIEGGLGDTMPNKIEIPDQKGQWEEQHSSNSVAGLVHNIELTSYVFGNCDVAINIRCGC